MNTNSEVIIVKEKTYTIIYVPKRKLYPLFGIAFRDQCVAYVREDLPIVVKRFVRQHELHHLTDTANWSGWIGSEIRANPIPGLKDPIGLLVSTLLTLSSLDRIRLYLKRFK